MAGELALIWSVKVAYPSLKRARNSRVLVKSNHQANTGTLEEMESKKSPQPILGPTGRTGEGLGGLITELESPNSPM